MSAEPPIRNTPDEELRELWQGQKLEGEKMSIDEIRSRARAFEKKIRNRNLVEYCAAAFVVVVFGLRVFADQNAFLRAGAALTVIATIFVVYFLYTRGSVRDLPEALGRSASLDFYRESLEHQRDLLRAVWLWYLLPFVPGLAVTMIGFAVRDGVLFNPVPSPNLGWQILNLLMVVFIIVGMFLTIAALNKKAARRIQEQIDALEDAKG